MAQAQKRRGAIILNIVLGTAALATFSTTMVMSSGFSSRVKDIPTIPITTASVSAAANVAGLDCDSLLAANVSSGSFATMFEDIVEYLEGHPNAIAERPAGPQGVFDAGLASLSGPQQATLTAIRANAAWKVPAAYKLTERTETEWIMLRDALADEMIVNRDGGELSGTVTSLLSTVRAANDGLVQNALDRISGSAASQTAWSNAAATAAGQ